MDRSQSPLAGVFWMLATGLFFVAVTATVKHVGSALPSSQAAFMRYALGLVFMVPLVPRVMRANLTRRDLGLFALRGGFHTFGVMLWFYAMTQISIAEVTAMNYLSPVYVTLGASIFLGEKIALRRIMAVLVALAGAVIIIRPGFREVSTGHLAMLIAAVVFAGSYLMMKRFSDRFDATIVVFMLSVTVAVGTAPFAFAVWVPPSLTQTAWMFAVAFFATAGHYTMTRAFAAAPVAVTQPVNFFQLVWAAILGALVFGEPIDVWVAAGGLMIVGSVTFIAWREAMVKRRQRAAPPVVTGS